MKPNELLRQWIDDNCVGKSAMARMEDFSKMLTPPVNKNMIFKWCSGKVNPRSGNVKKLKGITGVEFQPIKRRRRRLMPKSKAPLSVTFQELDLVPTDTPCMGCFIDGGSDECENTARAFSGCRCKSEGMVYKRKPIWVRCAPGNVKVGDLVRGGGGGIWEVRYIPEKVHRNIGPWFVLRGTDGSERRCRMNDLEVQI